MQKKRRAGRELERNCQQIPTLVRILTKVKHLNIKQPKPLTGTVKPIYEGQKGPKFKRKPRKRYNHSKIKIKGPCGAYFIKWSGNKHFVN
ncbi:MAG: hypothetical protein D5R97_09285 [Candidatus Syntrophonatronum acetioxidans]|uniref:Uncharacterized protein n=1 Tax=Candidatus Syntrophonatronum acetioxidans TaxID=1795816 RepID=A0A424YAF5_9FIRM|nr:MAG: hypothetical protein D5R97_09285 [Candidatus Syntrophonatronum acetioxidans]